ncbi:hypothetical protein EC957_011780 [Mortierella hygrophila]|uniref:Uncharacterized protein n=1 Tax=Mortierella hygrophila TaxID=979708 RepID=A0A9P6F8Y7_9FUNG|nr:hypothetical protein EC957_011780 [Mortierella hygrophila]
MASHQTAAIPINRHHKRSVDRVLPPALEVRLARLSIDEGESKSAHIVPAPPSLPLRMGMPDFERVYNQSDSQDSFSSSASSANSTNSNGLEFIVEGTPSSYTNKSRLGKLGSNPDKGTTGLHRRHDNHHHHRHRHHHNHQHQQHRSRSMLNPQSPSALLQIDQQHQQHYHQPNISVKYHRRSRSGSQLLGDFRGTNRTTNNGGGSPFRVPLFPKKTSGGGVYPTSPTIMTTEFGEDLFHWNTLELDNGFADSPTTATAIMEKTGLVDSHPHRQAGIYKCDGKMNEFDISLQACPSTYHTPPTLRSPSRKGPLSANSPRGSSRSRSPLQELSENAVGMRDRLFEFSQTKAQQGLRIGTLDNSGERLDVPKMDEDRLPPASPMSIGAMSNDQDRWKSPTLSALASPATSRGPSPRPLSPSPLSQRLVMVMGMHAGRGTTDKEDLYLSVSAAAEDDMNIEIPLIETRDEVPLQDIWRMEDEERKDRLNGAETTTDVASIEEHIAHMKGEQHAHEEARLIQGAIDAHSQAL